MEERQQYKIVLLFPNQFGDLQLFHDKKTQVWRKYEWQYFAISKITRYWCIGLAKEKPFQHFLDFISWARSIVHVWGLAIEQKVHCEKEDVTTSSQNHYVSFMASYWLEKGSQLFFKIWDNLLVNIILHCPSNLKRPNLLNHCGTNVCVKSIYQIKNASMCFQANFWTTVLVWDIWCHLTLQHMPTASPTDHLW